MVTPSTRNCCTQYSETRRHNTTTTTITTTSAWMLSPYTQHINTQLSTKNSINILYINLDFKILFKSYHFMHL